MRYLLKKSVLLILLAAPVSVMAQKEVLGTLKCPFEHGSGKEPKEPYTWEPKDEKIIMISKVDSIVRSCITGTISNVETTEDNNYQIVLYVKNYYFWYYGIEKPLVKKGQKVTAGEAIGTYKFGSELEFRMYKDEDQKDPRNLLECKITKADE